MDKATFEGLGIFAVKIAIAAFIFCVMLVGTIQVYKRLDRHNILVEAILNDYKLRAQRMEAQRELPLPDDPVPTEDKVR